MNHVCARTADSTEGFGGLCSSCTYKYMSDGYDVAFFFVVALKIARIIFSRLVFCAMSVVVFLVSKSKKTVMFESQKKLF